MRSKEQFTINSSVKFILITIIFLIMYFITIPSSTFSPLSVLYSKQTSPENQEPATRRGKIPASLAAALVHYATTKVTPQQTLDEISVSMRVLERKSPCNFLVFGLGYDSLMWAALNQGGRTVFLEESDSWIDQIGSRFPSLQSYHVVYDTKVQRAWFVPVSEQKHP